jgi:hypothetical protein
LDASGLGAEQPIQRELCYSLFQLLAVVDRCTLLRLEVEMSEKSVSLLLALTAMITISCAGAQAGYVKGGVHKVDKTAKGAVHATERGTKHVVRVSSNGVHKVTHGTHRLVKKLI